MSLPPAEEVPATEAIAASPGTLDRYPSAQLVAALTAARAEAARAVARARDAEQTCSMEPSRRAFLMQALGVSTLLSLASGCASGPRREEEEAPPPPAPREWRAVWVATVANIDWPSRPGLSRAALETEIARLLDRLAALHLNAVILQVRPSADAFYPSALEPWSEYLTGTQGKAPEPGFDPLERWIDEAHARGLELHAWINPFRARASAARSAEAQTHIARRAPELVRHYGDQLWLDPAEPRAQAHTLAVAEDILRRYDVDGLHLDDYFYPYPVRGHDGEELDFPDEGPWQRYLAAGGTLARADWRRAQVDQMVRELYQLVRQLRPEARFGISPFGLPRPDRRPPEITGFSQYDRLYANVERWLEEGWLDYLVPQLYWPRAQPGQPFEPLLRTWLSANARARHLFPGLFLSRLASSAAPANAQSAWPPEEILGQIALSRIVLGEVPGRALGHVHFSARAFVENRSGIGEALLREPYRDGALAPRYPWLEPTRLQQPRKGPRPPRVELVSRAENGLVELHLQREDRAAFRHVLAWREATEGRWRWAIQGASIERVRLRVEAEPGVPERLWASAVDREGLEGERIRLVLSRTGPR
ncbi:MAG: family 10 glycosylhydrolase [Casimicrobiaceae bacterium]|nr:family 10 glycosylhydrolase [Casimicrobiaceae bacterium]